MKLSQLLFREQRVFFVEIKVAFRGVDQPAIVADEDLGVDAVADEEAQVRGPGNEARAGIERVPRKIAMNNLG